MKLRLMAALLAALTTGAVTAQDTTSDKGKLSYAVGYEIGRDLNERKIDVDMNTVMLAIQDGHAKKAPAVPEEQMAQALRAMQEKMVADARAEFERVSNQNKAASDKFLADNRAKQGVTVLPSGIQYRVIENGNGRQPTATSDVQIHFRGSLHTGQEFASTYSINRVAADEVELASRSLFGMADLSVQAPGMGFDENLYPQLAAVPGVAVASPVVEAQARLPGREHSLKLVGIDPFRAARMQPALAAAGATASQGDPDCSRKTPCG